MAEASPNPYVGPRTFSYAERERFFGREREARELLARVISERLTLFYAQSGAGKSSLINTRLIPQLQTEDFAVLPVGRVSGALPEGVGSVDNIFAFNLLLSLDQSQGDPQRFRSMPLGHFLARLTSPDGERYYFEAEAKAEEEVYEAAPAVLIIDQFEELVTTHSEHWPQRADFFRQLDEAMAADPLLWVVLSLREDYVATLEPYSALLADKLRARFYMQRMGYEAALEAIRRPAELGGRPFAPGVAENLVDNLRQIRIQGQETSQPGQYVEPVQLQVVCYQLWENLQEKDPQRFSKPLRSGQEITADDLRDLGNVDTALAEFYEGVIRNTLTGLKQTPAYAPTPPLLGEGKEPLPLSLKERGPGGEVSELRLRRWFDQELITEAGTRGTVYQGTTETAGLPNAAVKRLADQFLLRAELRAGGTWYELVHDRFVEPIQQANRAWEAERLQRNPLAAPAAAWQNDPAKLLDGAQLRAAVEYAETNPLDVTEEEREFLTESLRREVERQEQARQAARRRRVTAIAGVVVVIALGLLTVWGWQSAVQAEQQREVAKAAQATAERNAQRAEEQAAAAATAQAQAGQQAQVSHSRQLAAQSVSARLDGALDLALLLSMAASTITDTLEARDSLLGGFFYSPRLQHYLTGHTGGVYSVAFSPDGQTLASGSGDTILLWDLSQPDAPVRLAQPLTGHTGGVYSVAFSPDGQTLASGSGDTILLWDLSQPDAPVRLAQPLTGHTDLVLSVAFSPDGQTLASGSLDNTIILWDLSQPDAPVRLAQPLTGHTGPVYSVAFSPDTLTGTGGQTLASGGEDTTIILWDLSQPDAPVPLAQPLTSHTGGVYSVAFSPDGQTLASGSSDTTIILWDLSQPDAPVRLAQPLTGHTGPVYSVAFSPDGQTLASGSLDNTILLWDLSQPDAPVRLAQPLTGHTDGINSVAFSPDGQTLASGSSDTTIILWDPSQPDAPVRLAQPLTGHTDGINSVAFSPDGQTLASGSGDTILLWDLSQPDAPVRLGQPLTGHTNRVTSVAFSPDGQTLASGSWDTTILLWDLSQPDAPVRLAQSLTGHNAGVYSVAFSPDTLTGTGGQTLASGSDDNTILLWDLSQPDAPVPLAQPLTGHTGPVYSVAFSPDGQTLASGSLDTTILLWDLSQPDAPVPLAQPLTGHTDWVYSVAFSPDGQTLASGSGDTTILLWDLSRESWQTRACRIANRNLTQAEWQRYLAEVPYQKLCPHLPAGE